MIPDRSQPRSSGDGGVIWPVVPTGTYTITGHDATTSFAPFTATCAPGRIVNANPPWGLHELGLANPTRYSAGFAGARPTTLKLSHLPPGATVVATCTGAGCPFTSRTLARATTRRTLDARAKVSPARLRAGQTLALAISAHRYDGVTLRWRLRSDGRARAIARTVPLGG